MASGSVGIPDDFEILKSIESPGPASEYLARNKTEDTLVLLRTYDLTGIGDETARRQLREYLRNELTFLDELDLPGIIRLYDYSDAKKSFWIATQPPKITRLSRSFDLLQSLTLDNRHDLVTRFLSILQQIHERRIVHRNLSSDAIFLDNKPEIFIGDFGCASYISDQPIHTRKISSTTSTCYQAPELKNAETFAPGACCDIYSAALLVFEILSGTALNKENVGEIINILRAGLEVEISKGIIGKETAEVILKAT
ncbi:MAG: protein kinase family protein, partial [Planctomycetota bacterium]